MHSLNRGLELALLLTIPAALALIAIPWPVIVTLFERGAFDRTSSEATALVLAAFALGLPGYALIKVLQPGFFAREDTVTPLRIAVAAVVANVVLSLALFWQLGHVGIALATALAAWLNTVLLALGLRRRGYLALDDRLKRRLPRIALASALMGLALWGAGRWFAPWFDGDLTVRVAGLAILVAGGLGLYGALALALGAVRLDEIKALRARRAG